ncbi:MAG: RNA 2',3'-cyclic phosphodiesterase [Planctomycetota bacterium]|nr:RNA 2',3'-cyclic phosphodiesterase [Planctomycetota bacterium]
MPWGQVRLFVALYPPIDLARRWLSLAHTRLAPDRRVKFRQPPPEQIHLTAMFIGPVEMRERDDIAESVERSASGLKAFALTARSLTTLPKAPTPPRTLCVATDAPPTLLELRRRLVHRLARNPKQRREEFLPHLTVARFEHEKGIQIEEPLPAPESFPVGQIVLIESLLTPDGPEHTPALTVTLGS